MTHGDFCVKIYFNDSLTLKHRTDGLSRNVGTNYKSRLRKIPEERRSQGVTFFVETHRHTEWTHATYLSEVWIAS